MDKTVSRRAVFAVAGTAASSAWPAERGRPSEPGSEVDRAAPFPGAVVRSAMARHLDQGVSVKDFGAVGDGKVDDAAAILRAVASLTHPGGSNSYLWLPSGRYLVGQQILLPSGVSLRGSGSWSTIITVANSFDADGAIKCNGGGGPPTTVSGIGVVAAVGGAGPASVGINVQANGTFVRDVWINGFHTNIVLGSSDVFLSDFAVEETNSGGTGILITSTSVTIAAPGVIYNCYVGLNAVQGADSGAADVVIVDGIRATACLYASFVSSGVNTHFTGCTAVHNNASRLQNFGFYVTGSGNKLTGNTVAIDSAKEKASGDGFFVSAHNCTMIGNTANNMARGFVVSGSKSGCVMNANAANANKGPGFVISGLVDLTFTGNTANGNGSGKPTDANFNFESTCAYAVWTICGNTAVQSGGGAAAIGFLINLTDNGPASGKINFGLNAAGYHTTDYRIVGLTSAITQTANI